jgi:ATP-dependent DNA helicase RecG
VPPVPVRSRLRPCTNSAGARDHLLIFDVEPSEMVHATTADDVYLRVGDENRRLSFGQRQELQYDKGQAQFDAIPVRGVGVKDLRPDLLSHYASAIGHPDPDRALRARSLVTRAGRVTTAAYLLFGEFPQDAFPTAHVRILRYGGVARESGQRQQLRNDSRFDGPIPDVITNAISAVRDLQPKRRMLGANGLFIWQGIIPEHAWIEGIVNAVVHRSYSLGGDHIRVSIFGDRIEIESPGRFPGLVDIDDPRHVVRFARNPRIARVCADLCFGQELGEGIRRMFEEMRVRGLAEPLYTQTRATVRLTLSALALTPELAARLRPGHLRILDLLRGGTSLSTGELAEALGASRPTVLRMLATLRDGGLVEWVGKSPQDPRASWRLYSEG